MTTMEAPQRRILQGIIARNAALQKQVAQAPIGSSNLRPMALCATWGPIGQQTPRRAGSAGFEFLAPLVSPGVYLTPNYPSAANNFVSTAGPFVWCSTWVGADFCWTYTYQPYETTESTTTLTDNPLTAGATTVNVAATGLFAAAGSILIGTEMIDYTGKTGTSFTGCTRGVRGSTAVSHAVGATVSKLTARTAPVAGVPQSKLFAPAIPSNGGGIILNNFAGTQQFSGAPVHPRICATVNVYDRTRNRSIGDRAQPIENYCAGGYGFKKIKQTTFEHGTELEARLYVTECRMTDIMDDTATYLAADVGVYVTMVFKGFTIRPSLPVNPGVP